MMLSEAVFQIPKVMFTRGVFRFFFLHRNSVRCSVYGKALQIDFKKHEIFCSDIRHFSAEQKTEHSPQSHSLRRTKWPKLYPPKKNNAKWYHANAHWHQLPTSFAVCICCCVWCVLCVHGSVWWPSCCCCWLLPRAHTPGYSLASGRYGEPPPFVNFGDWPLECFASENQGSVSTQCIKMELERLWGGGGWWLCQRQGCAKMDLPPWFDDSEDELKTRKFKRPTRRAQVPSLSPVWPCRI